MNETEKYKNAFTLACIWLQKGYIDAVDRRGWSVMKWEEYLLSILEGQDDSKAISVTDQKTDL